MRFLRACSSVALIATICGRGLDASAQLIAPEIGAGVVFGKGHLTKTLGNDPMDVDIKTSFSGMGLFPRFIIPMHGVHSLSIGAPITVGLTGRKGDRWLYEHFPLGLDVAGTLDFNFGRGALAHPKTTYKHGGFIGVGYGYTYDAITRNNYYYGIWDESDYFVAETNGVIIHGGYRFPLGLEDLGLTLRGFVRMDGHEARYRFIGINCYLHFGGAATK
jgi:hypothetical protein